MNFIAKIHADLFFSGVYLVFEVFQDAWRTTMMGVTKTTKTIQTATNNGVECWILISRHHGTDENHRNLGCKPRIPWKTGSEMAQIGIPKESFKAILLKKALNVKRT